MLNMIRSLFDYAAPVLFPNYSSTSIERLQKIQNCALRLATGCLTASSVDHFHAETRKLPIRDHLELLSAQFLAKVLDDDVPPEKFLTVLFEIQR